jgi:hypothetical protein
VFDVWLSLDFSLGGVSILNGSFKMELHEETSDSSTKGGLFNYLIKISQ